MGGGQHSTTVYCTIRFCAMEIHNELQPFKKTFYEKLAETKARVSYRKVFYESCPVKIAFDTNASGNLIFYVIHTHKVEREASNVQYSMVSSN